MKTTLVMLIALLTGLQETPNNKANYSVDGQERCEAICLGCIDSGGEPEDCANNIFFRLCCHQNGGHTSGCGCREGL